MTWAYDTPIHVGPPQHHTPNITLYGPPRPQAKRDAWSYATPALAGPPRQLGAAPQDARVIWYDRPVDVGLHWMTVVLPKPMLYSKLAEIYATQKPPWDESMYPLVCGAFSKIQNGQQVLVYGEEITQGYEQGTLTYGDQEGQYQLNNALYAWGDPVTKYVDQLFFYGIMLEEGDVGNLDPYAGGITAYYAANGALLYEQDGAGNTGTPSQALSGVPALFLWGFVAFLLTYFGFFGETAQNTVAKILTTLVSAGLEGLKQLATKLKEALKTGLGNIAGATGKMLASAFPWLIGATIATAIVWQLSSDSGGRR